MHPVNSYTQNSKKSILQTLINLYT